MVAGAFHHLDDVAIGVFRGEIVDPHAAGLAAPVEALQRLDDLLARAFFGTRRYRVFEIEKYMVGAARRRPWPSFFRLSREPKVARGAGGGVVYSASSCFLLNDLALAQVVDFGRQKPDSPRISSVCWPSKRRTGPDLSWRLGELDRDARKLDRRGGAGIGGFDNHVAHREMRVLRNVVDVVDRTEGNLARRKSPAIASCCACA